MKLMAQMEKAAVERQSDPLNKTCAGTPIQERVDTEKRDRYSDDIDKVGTQKIGSIVGLDIQDVETDDANHIKGMNNQVRHEPGGASLLDLRNQRNSSKY